MRAWPGRCEVEGHNVFYMQAERFSNHTASMERRRTSHGPVQGSMNKRTGFRTARDDAGNRLMHAVRPFGTSKLWGEGRKSGTFESFIRPM